MTSPDQTAPMIDRVSQALPYPLLLVHRDGAILEVNPPAEAFFDMGQALLQRTSLAGVVGPHSALADIVRKAHEETKSINIYRVALHAARFDRARLVDIHAAPLPDRSDIVMLLIQERTIIDKFNRQLGNRNAVRTASGMAALLAHEIKNPLSGIRGAAQLLETSVPAEDRTLTSLIRDETDRIVKLVDRFEMFSDHRRIEMEEVNIHAVLDHVRHLALSGVARTIRITQAYDPSLPPLICNRDLMVQVILNLVKNAAEAIGTAPEGEIVLTTAYKPGVSMLLPETGERVRLPLEVCVRDNGPGIPEDIRAHLFDAFVTTKVSGSGLGLALASKVIGDHGGIIECESVPRRTVFRMLMPLQSSQSSGHGSMSS
jgi:two-component system, NtrC family, nitrogen regulation sensor histidine kinase GlnL